MNSKNVLVEKSVEVSVDSGKNGQAIRLSKENMNEDDLKLLDLLKEFDLEILFSEIKSCGLTFRCLRYLGAYHMKDVIKNTEHRIEFWKKLCFWKKINRIDDESLRQISKVKEWMKKNQITSSRPPRRCVYQ